MSRPRKWKNPSYIDGQNTRIYNLWLHMRNRCTEGSRSQITNPTYANCVMFEGWYDYDEFYKWVTSNKFHDFICRNGFYYQLDKDLKYKGNRLYSPETCEFIPKEINTFLTKREKCRGTLPIGVHLHDFGIFRTTIRNPFTKRTEHLGLYSDPLIAFETYKVRKETFARMLVEVYSGKLSNDSEKALLNYNVESTD